METKRNTTLRKASGLHLHFNLKQMKDQDKPTQIMLVTTVNKKRIRVYTKLRIEPKHWDKQSNRCVAHSPISMRDRKKLAETGEYLTSQSVRKAIITKQTGETPDFQPIAYMYQQVDEYLTGLNRRGKQGIASTQRTYLTALKRLENFCQHQYHPIRSFEDFDSKFFTSFADYLYTCTYQKGNQLSDSPISETLEFASKSFSTKTSKNPILELRNSFS